MEPAPRRLSEHWTTFTFDGRHSAFTEPTVVAVVDAGPVVVVVDTHTGGRSMAAVLRHLEGMRRRRPLVVVYTHADWDHVWGTAALAPDLVVAHEHCREAMASDEDWEGCVAAYGGLASGAISRVLPDLTFGDRLSLPGAGLTLLAGPGHTKDSILVHDERDSLLFVGDDLEEPIPWLQTTDLNAYVDTLGLIDALAPRLLLTSHSDLAPPDLTARTRAYLTALRDGTPWSHEDERVASVHEANLRVLGRLT